MEQSSGQMEQCEKPCDTTSIARNKFHSALDYSDNFEMSFEYQALTVPQSGNWHQILIVKSSTSTLFGFYYNGLSAFSSGDFKGNTAYALKFDGDRYFSRKISAFKWYKMKIIQTKDSQSNNCNVEAWLQNELVLETSYTCRTYDSDLALYTAGDYKYANGDNR